MEKGTKVQILSQKKKERRAIKTTLQFISNPSKAQTLQRFFKTGKGEYGEGDVFLGVTVPESRKVAQAHLSIPLAELEELLTSKFHEERLVALLILVEKFKKSTATEQKTIYDFYLAHRSAVNNWDLVDLSADKIVGTYLIGKDSSILTTLSQSKNLWDRRIAIISTFHFIKNNQFEETFRIAELLLNDKHDLIHKAVGWMLREIGKRNKPIEEEFLKKHYKIMPRTMLRYAIERFPESERKRYLSGTIKKNNHSLFDVDL